MFTEEVHATRALGAVLHHDPAFAVSWLRSIGIEVDRVQSVSVEHPYKVPGTDGVTRRADVYLGIERAGNGDDGHDEGDAGAETVIIEAKVDALVDDEQLEHAGQVADRVLCLLPDELPGPDADDVLVATWEDLVDRMEKEGNDLLSFLGRQFAALVDSPRVRARRSLAMIVANVEVPDGWWLIRGGESTSGNALGIVRAPSRGEHFVSVELANEQRGQKVEPYAYVLTCSTLSSTDPVVIEALRQADLPSADGANVAYRPRGGSRKKFEREALDAAGVPRARTYGYGQTQLEKYGWSGYGPLVDLTTKAYSEDDVREWLAFVVKVAVAADKALALALERN